MKLSCRLFLVSLFILSSPAPAADTGQKTTMPLHWRCWYDQRVHIACLVDTVATGGTESLAASLPANLPGTVRAMRLDPGSFAGWMIHIPLLTEPYDMALTAVLARAAACGSRRDCSVDFTATLPPIEELAALLDREPPDTGTAPGPTRLAGLARFP